MSRRSRRSPRPGRGALTLIAVLLLVSGLVRFGTGSGPAIAREVAALDRIAPDAPLVSKSCETDADVARVLEALRKREGELDAREGRIEARLRTLEEAEAEMELTLAELSAAEAALDETIVRAQTAAEDDLGQLTALYEAMGPKQAAALFEQMEPSFSAGFLARMRPEAAAEIMAGLTPGTAYSISVVLAARNARVPTE